MRRIILCLAVIVSAPLRAQVGPPPAAPSGTPAAKTAPEPISLTQIAPRAEELTRKIRDILHGLPADSELTAFDEQLQAQEMVVESSARASSDAIFDGAATMEVREHLREWKAMGLKEASQRKVLDQWGAAGEKSRSLLTTERELWDITMTSSRNLPEFKVVLPRVKTALAEIDQARAAAERTLRTVLALQGRLSKQGSAIADTAEKLTAYRFAMHSQIFQPDAPPIWRLQRQAATETAAATLTRSIARSIASIGLFATDNKTLVAALLVLLVAVLAGARLFKRTAAMLDTANSSVLLAAEILRRPFSLAVLIASPVILTAYPLARITEVLLLTQIFLLPITRLLPLFVRANRTIYLIVGFFLVNGVVTFLDIDQPTKRLVLAAVFLVAIAAVAWWGRPRRFRPAGPLEQSTAREIVFTMWAIPTLVVVLSANVFGFIPLSYMLRLGTIVTMTIALVLYTLARVAEVLFITMVEFPRVSRLATVRLHKALLVRWPGRLFRLGALVFWISSTLHLLDIHEVVYDWIATVLNSRFGVRAFDISLGDVLGFLSVLVFGYLIAIGLRFILREEILPGWELPRGLPDTISSSVYYVALLFVFFLSLSAAGVELGKLTFMSGALGVGLGFGLQTIVNNFVSGLILQFERPIRVGDVLEVGEFSGEIRSIGIRASTLRTWQGAEVIIPNSAFVSGQVINWTLSESFRRVEIPVGVAYGTDPQQVIKMLVDIAGNHANVRPNPEPSAVFKGFGESSLDFLLMFWAHQEHHFQLRSEVSVEINAALQAAGIEIPFPQRDIRVHTVPPSTFGHSA